MQRKKWFAGMGAMLLTALQLTAGNNLAAEMNAWKANAPKEVAAPILTAVKDDAGNPGIRVTAAADGPWQGMGARFGSAAMVKEGMTLSFKVRQHVRGKAVTFYLELKQQGAPALNCNVNVPPDQWTTVTIPFKAGEWQTAHKEPVTFATLTEFGFFPYRALDAKDLYYEVADLKVLDTEGHPIELSGEAPPPKPIVEPDLTYTKLEYWKGGNGTGQVPPELSLKDTIYGPAVVATVVEKAAYQGLMVTLPEAVDLNNVGIIQFNVGQNVISNGGEGAIFLKYEGGTGSYGRFAVPKGTWGEVQVPVDTRSLNSDSKGSTATLGKVKTIVFSLYSNLREPGQFLGVANLKFLPKSNSSAPLKAERYTHNAKPTSGDGNGTALTDGKIEKENQAHYREYSDDPDITFDLGALYWVDGITLSAVAVPNQNVSAFLIYSSDNGKDWRAGGHVKSTNDGSEETSYSIKGENLKVVGRYVRIHCERTRTDFPLAIAEVSFTGKIPTDEELAAVLAENYDLGPAMPEISAKDYATIRQGDRSLAISRTNGVACAYTIGDKVVAERVFSRYELGNGRERKTFNAYNCKVVKLDAAADHATVTLQNPQFPQLTLIERWGWESGILSRKLEVQCKGTIPAVFFSGLDVVLSKTMRANGLYETWGAAHTLLHKSAGEIAFDLPADGAPVVQFESISENLAFLCYRYRYNGRYLHLSYGDAQPYGFAEKRSIYTPNGWSTYDGIWNLKEPAKQPRTVETLLQVTPGTVMEAYDRYQALDEVKKFRSTIHRAAWLDDFRFGCGEGWDGYFGENSRRIAQYYDQLIREGSFIYWQWDNDFSWGDYLISGDVRNLFGGRVPAETLRDRARWIKKNAPHTKQHQYIWYHSFSKLNKNVIAHPEWFLSKTVEGREQSFFPGWGINYILMISAPGAREALVKAVVDFVNYYEQDIWYLDGGGTPAMIDWYNLRIDSPTDWMDTTIEIRNKLQEGRPDRVVFFNNPENPLGDLGYVESFGGALTTNWREGATWMYKFKLWQRHDPRHIPLYIYWLAGVDHAYRQYAIGTGLGLCFGGSPDTRNDAALISAAHESHPVRGVNAHVSPNWRRDNQTELEVQSLSFGPSGWLLIKNHAKTPYQGGVSADLAPLGLTDAAKPVYQWCFTMRPQKNHKGLLGEPEREENYRNSRWASDFLLGVQYLGSVPYAARLEQQFTVAPDEMQLWYVSQSPAFVYSVDELRNQLWIDKNLKVTVSGTSDASGAALQVESERKSAEIALLIPDGSLPASVTVNGAAVTPGFLMAPTRLALIPVGEGKSEIKVAWQAAPKAGTPGTLKVIAGTPGKTLQLELSGSNDAAPVLAVTNGGDTVWSAPGAKAEIKIPTGVTGGTYTAIAYSADGTKLAEKKFNLASGTPKVGRFLSSVPMPGKTTEGGDAEHGRWAWHGTEGCGTVTITPEKNTVHLQMAPNLSTAWGMLEGVMETHAKRYCKIRLRGNFDWFAKHGPRPGLKGLHVKYDNPAAFLGLSFEFADANGNYVYRTLAGTGHVQNGEFKSSIKTLGSGRAADMVAGISNFALGDQPEEIFWIDLAELGMPENWSGKMLFGIFYPLVVPDRFFEAAILETSDTLPAGAKTNKVFYLKGKEEKKERQSFKVPRISAPITIDGAGNEAAWSKALEFHTFTLIGTPGMEPPYTSFRLMADQQNLYVLATLKEPNASGFTIDPNNRPWFNDGVEVYLTSRDKKESYLQFIFSLANVHYACQVAGLQHGATEKKIAIPNCVTAVKGDTAVVEAAIPLALLGSKLPASGLNLGRNRTVDGVFYPFALASGKHYKVFDQYELVW